MDAYSLQARTFRHSCAPPPLSDLHHYLLGQHLHPPLTRLGPGSAHLLTLPWRPYWFLSPFSPRSLSGPFLWDLFHFSPTALSTLRAPHSLEPASLLIGFNTSKKNFNFANFSFPVAFQDPVPSPNLPSPGPAPQPSAPAPSGGYIQSFPTLHLTLLLFWGIFLQCSSYARVSGRLTSGRISGVHTLHIGPTVDRQLGGGSAMCLPCQGVSFPSAGSLV